jgi:hypothetical protein
MSVRVRRKMRPRSCGAVDGRCRARDAWMCSGDGGGPCDVHAPVIAGAVGALFGELAPPERDAP